MRSRVAKTVERAIGPAPWYWHTFPNIPRATDGAFEWRHSGTTDADTFLVTLVEAANPDVVRMALGMYSRAFLVPSSRLGLWFEKNSSIQVFCFDPEALNPFSTSAIPDDFKRDRSHFFCLGPPLAKMTIPCGLAEGVHEFRFPPEFVRVDELFAIASNP